MKTMHALAVLVGASALTVGAMSSASAAPQRAAAATCSGGDIASGTYSSLTVTGFCTVPDGSDVTVLGNLTIAPNAFFDAGTDSHVAIGGNVIAGPGSSFALGCTAAHPCDNGNPPSTDKNGFPSTMDTVGGNVILNHVFNAAIDGDWIGGNLVSTGGGAGPLDPETDFVPFSVKDDVVEGNIVVTGLNTVWFGVIRTQVGGNVVLQGVHNSDPDGNEVVTDVISGNLVCHGNNPASQFGDAVGEPQNGPNTVGGRAVGQCAGLTG